MKKMYKIASKERIKTDVKELASSIDVMLDDAIMLRNNINSRIRKLNKRFAFKYQMSKCTPPVK